MQTLQPPQLWELYKKLPQELQNIVISEELDNKMDDICTKNKIDDVRKLTELTQNVLLGILPPEKFQEELKNNLKVDTNIATALAEQTDKLIFAPVKIYLNRLYNKGPKEKTINNNPDNDSYREPIK
jgi:hypothetical protein